MRTGDGNELNTFGFIFDGDPVLENFDFGLERFFINTEERSILATESERLREKSK